MKLKELLSITEVTVPSVIADENVTMITLDSRKVFPGSLFVAIKGFSSDGHSFIQKALDAGAVAVVTERPVSGIDPTLILVNKAGDNRELLSRISAVFFSSPWKEMKTVGITGTNGKTSTAHILRWIMEKRGIQTGIMGTVGHIAGGKEIPASVTTPDSLDVARYMRQMVNSGDRSCVMEVSSHALALCRVNSVRFDVTLFTNISQDHLDFHSTMEEYLNSKKKLFSLTKQDGVKIVGTYSTGWPRVKDAITFGERAEDTYRIRNISVELSGSNFLLCSEDGEFPVTVQAPGRFNVYNAAGAIAAAVQLGVSIEEAVQAVRSFSGVPGRMERVNCGQKYLVAVDYAHTPDALERVLKQGSLLAENKLIVVFGCGGDRDNRKRPLMGRIAVDNADLVFVTSDNPRTEDPYAIITDILAGIPQKYNPVVEQDRATAIRSAINAAVEGDVVIIAGKGHEDYQILGVEKIHFDDREQARIALADMGYICAL